MGCSRYCNGEQKLDSDSKGSLLVNTDLLHKLPGAAFSVEHKKKNSVVLNSFFSLSDVLSLDTNTQEKPRWDHFVKSFDFETQAFLNNLLHNTYKDGEVFQHTAMLLKSNPAELKIIFCKYHLINPTQSIWYFYLQDLKIEESLIKHVSIVTSKYDELTQLPNRSLFSDRLHQAQSFSKRKNTSIAILFLDLDGFKYINDEYGHEAGDFVLIEVAKRLVKFFRESDTVARFGGDEFCAILTDLKEEKIPDGLINRLLKTIALPVEYKGVSLGITGSIGITFFPQNENLEPDQLIRQADQAMYKAKQAGKNSYSLFDQKLDFKERQKNQLISEITHGFKNNKLLLHYLPKINLKSERVIGVEALLRWNHPSKGLITASDFIDEIERTPIALEISNWVLEQGIKKCQEFQDLGINLSVSINVSLEHIISEDFCDKVIKIANNFGLKELSLLELEIRESGKIKSFISVNDQLHKLKKLGIGITFDNFGTGYLSLSYLWQMPIDRIKIDSSLVKDMLTNQTDNAIVKASIGIVLGLGRDVVACGIESKDIANALMQQGCFEGEGYGIARPMPEEDLMSWVTERNISSPDRSNKYESSYE